MKIAIDISQIIYGTGVSVYTRNLVSHLVKLYPHDDYLLFGGSLRRRHELTIFTNRLKTASRFYSMPPKLMDLLWNSFHVLPVEKLIGQVDVIHTSDWAEPPSRIPKVTTVHDLIPFKYPHTTQEGIRVAHKKRIAWVSKESSLILSVSRSTKLDLMDLLKIPEDKIVVTPEGVEDFYKPQPPNLIEAVKNKFHIEGDFIFSLSTLEPRKNQQRLIEAFNVVKENFPGLSLVIGGRTGWGEVIRPVEGVILTGYIPDADLPALYSGCLAYALPSLYEGFSLSHLQAMACGAAVVGSSLSSMPEVIGNSGILVNPVSVAEIAMGIIRAIKDRVILGEKGKKRAKLFTWEETARLTHDAYEKVYDNRN
jgi:glycosyltransferase involved in cell wall biosynthesis